MLSVADGVGGWNDLGINPSLYSKNLSLLIEELFSSDIEVYTKDPTKLLVDSVSKNEQTGTCTSLIITLDKCKPIIYISSIGDCSYLILRPHRIKDNISLQLIFQSKEQCKSFNLPYQVGTYGDDPSTESFKTMHQIKQNDIIVCGSDGLFDNLDIFQITQTIIPFIEKETIVDINLLSESLARFAFDMSLDTKYKSPFYKKAKCDKNFIGGKEDDITVIVAQINLDRFRLSI